LLSAYQSEWCL